jgi:LuxR family maltose regulon positive regulatory protein
MEKTTSTITTREVEILRRLAAGGSKATIAAELGVSIHTISTHVRKLYIKLDAHTAAQAVMRGVELQLIEVRRSVVTADGDIK